MRYNSSIQHDTAGIIRYSCGILFLAFCFCYLAFLRGDVLAEIQFVLSNGLTHYSVLIGACIITAVLQIIQIVVSKLVSIPDKHHAITYVPSFIALAMLIGMDQNMDGQFVWGVWRWLLPLLIFIWLAMVFLLKAWYREDRSSDRETIQAQMWPNYLMMLLMISACGFVSTTPAVSQYELKTERMLLQKDYEAAAAVGLNSLDANERLTQLRAYSLSKQNLLGDSLFTYPQYFGTKGLLLIHDEDTTRRFDMHKIELYLGAYAGQTIKTPLRFLEILALEDTVPTPQSQQYLLCYHLLDRNLHNFNDVLHHVYGDTIEAELPRAYQEAVVMQHNYTPDSLPIYINKVYVEKFDAYKQMRDSITNKVEKKNYTRRMYGDTYWWYFDN